MNNTLLGRMLVGPVMTMVPFYAADVRQMRAGERRVQLAYGLHGIGLLAVLLFWQVFAVWSLWVWLAAAYAALSVLKIRTYLEHRAHEQARGRSVIIEDTGPLSFLFLNNNLHAVHHCHPQVPWYRLRQLYRENRAGFLARNGGYVYRSYAEIFRLYACRIKDPVPHPLLPIGTGSVAPMIETEAVHPLGPLQADQRPLDPGQKEQA